MGRKTYGHDEAADADVRGKPFSYSGELPENAKEAAGALGVNSGSYAGQERRLATHMFLSFRESTMPGMTCRM